MTRFLDVRASAVGGSLAASVAVAQGTSIQDYRSLDSKNGLADIEGRDVLIATHGFNVDRKNGIACLANWEKLLRLDAQSVFLGLLWPGDSIWAHGLDYPEEPRIADEAGQLIASFLDGSFAGAASVSFASHSLGARVVLEAVSHMSLPVRRATLMAGAIDDNCLNEEFKSVPAKIGEMSILASRQDHVLSELFPIGNLLAGIVTQGHPWWRAALGRGGPSIPRPGNFQAPFQIPNNWNFDHGDYLRIDAPPTPPIPRPADVPPNGAALPAGGAAGWREAWSAAFAFTRFR
jgi:alpha/beta hydrolase family protein DUF900